MNSSIETREKNQGAAFASMPPNLRGTQREGARPTMKSPNGLKEVSFELNASSAKEVLLAGDFTNWEKTPIKLRKGERGAWRAQIKLPPGQYHYKFVVDGQWQPDPKAASSSPDPFGSRNSVVEIR